MKNIKIWAGKMSSMMARLRRCIRTRRVFPKSFSSKDRMDAARTYWRTYWLENYRALKSTCEIQQIIQQRERKNLSPNTAHRPLCLKCIRCASLMSLLCSGKTHRLSSRMYFKHRLDVPTSSCALMNQKTSSQMFTVGSS